MKSKRGVTLMSLTVYIMLMLIVIAILATVRANFQSNIKEISKEGTEVLEINKFNMYFLQEVKKQGNEINAISEDRIEFKTGNKYIFDSDDNIIYLNENIKIAQDIETCIFSFKQENGKTIINVTIKAKNSDVQVKEYVLTNEKLIEIYEDESDYTS